MNLHVPTLGHNKPRFLIDPAKPNLMVAQLRDLLLGADGLYERGIPVRLAVDNVRGEMIAQPVTAELLTIFVHEICQPYIITRRGEERDIRLPAWLANTYLQWLGEWRLSLLNGIASAPILLEGGHIVTKEGYEQTTGIYLQKLPDLSGLVPAHPSDDDALRALNKLRVTFRTFAFADADLLGFDDGHAPIVDTNSPPGKDESAFLVGLLTAVCRPSLVFAPGLLAPAQVGIGGPSRGNCSIYSGWRDQLEVRFGHGFRALGLLYCSYNSSFTFSCQPDNTANGGRRTLAAWLTIACLHPAGGS